MEARIIRQLRNIGIWIPGSGENINTAFEFWAPLFNWRNPANCPKVKQRRLAAVETLCAYIYVMPHGVLGFQSIYYKEQTDLCKFFWQRASTFATRNGHRFEVREWRPAGARYPIKGYTWMKKEDYYKTKVVLVDS